MEKPIVFISYSHDSEAHRARVLELSQRLRTDGCETILDQYVNGSPPETWPRWMLNGLERATHVICVCTETYYRRFRGKEVPGKGKGVDWEGAIITQELYDARSRNTKFIPLVVRDEDASCVPEPLRGATRYRYDPEYQRLYDAILGQAGVEPAPVGELQRKPRTAPPAEAVAGEASATTAATREPTPEELEKVFLETIHAIEEQLASAPDTAKFVCEAAKVTPRMFRKVDDSWKVADTFRRGRANVQPVLEDIARRVGSFSRTRHEWDALELVVGGIFVLGLDPLWVWKQRDIATSSPVQHPKFAATVTIENENTARFLVVLAAALAKGCARLARVFGAVDKKSIPDANDRFPGLHATDRAKEIKRHFIRFVLGPDDDAAVAELDGAALDTAFNRTRQLLEVARKIDRDPYLAAGPRLAKLADEIKQHLELSDLYLFVPAASGSESDLMTDPVIALTLLHRIHTHIHTHRPSI